MKSLVSSFSAVLDVARGGRTAARRGGLTAFSNPQLASELPAAENGTRPLEGGAKRSENIYFWGLFFSLSNSERSSGRKRKKKKGEREITKEIDLHSCTSTPTSSRRIKQGKRDALTRHFSTGRTEMNMNERGRRERGKAGKNPRGGSAEEARDPSRARGDSSKSLSDGDNPD